VSHTGSHGTQREDTRENGDEASVSPSVGEFIRKHRQLADLSLRQMAEPAQVSNAYLSQIERGLHQPSFACFGRSPTPSTFPRRPCSPRPGIFHPTHGAPDTATATQVTDTETAIRNDPHLTPDDRDALIRIYRSLRKPPSD
jgi:Helix-turn-helix domain